MSATISLNLSTFFTRVRVEDAQVSHRPVMLKEVLETLHLPFGGVAVDGTLGLAGHAVHMLEAVGSEGVLLGFDWDTDMLSRARGILREKYGNQIRLFHADFREMPETLDELDLKADGVLLDLGLNSAQIEDSSRGIAFREEGPLDMRMDRTRGEPASALLNRLSPHEIEAMLWHNGDERWAKAIARKIVERRKVNPLRTTTDLVDAVLAAIPSGARDKRIHPATRTFQAVRIAVNNELEGLQDAVEEIAARLAPGGTLAILSYHSGEDRAVKNAFRALAAGPEFVEMYKKPLTPTASEIATNPRSRSAKLRALQRKKT